MPLVKYQNFKINENFSHVVHRFWIFIHWPREPLQPSLCHWNAFWPFLCALQSNFSWLFIIIGKYPWVGLAFVSLYLADNDSIWKAKSLIFVILYTTWSFHVIYHWGFTSSNNYPIGWKYIYMYLEFNLATWLITIKFTGKNICEILIIEYHLHNIGSHCRICENSIVSGIWI